MKRYNIIIKTDHILWLNQTDVLYIIRAMLNTHKPPQKIIPQAYLVLMYLFEIHHKILKKYVSIAFLI